MAHYAYLDEHNVVTNVIVGKDETDTSHDWEQYYGALRTSRNTIGGIHYDAQSGEPSQDQSKAYRFNYACIGGSFNPDFGPDGAFISPQPYPSWVLNPDTALWDAPVPMPTDGGPWAWDEDTLSWVEVTA